MKLILLLFILPIPWVTFVWNSVGPDPNDSYFERMEQELVVRLDKMHEALSQNAKAIDTLEHVQQSFARLKQLDSNFQDSQPQTARERTARSKTQGQNVEMYAKEYTQEVEKFLVGWVKATDFETSKAALAVGNLVQEMVDKTGRQFDIEWPKLSKKLSPVHSGYPFWEASAIVDWAEAAMQGATDNKVKHEKLLTASRIHFWDLNA
jgi:hypothetical protein